MFSSEDNLHILKNLFLLQEIRHVMCPETRSRIPFVTPLGNLLRSERKNLKLNSIWIAKKRSWRIASLPDVLHEMRQCHVCNLRHNVLLQALERICSLWSSSCERDISSTMCCCKWMNGIAYSFVLWRIWIHVKLFFWFQVEKDGNSDFIWTLFLTLIGRRRHDLRSLQ